MQIVSLFLSVVIFICIQSAIVAWGFQDEKKGNHFGKVVIVLSRGRSGSGWLCRVLANVVKIKRDLLAVELFGGTGSKMLLIDNPTSFMKHWLLSRRARHPKNYIGFKWKPYADTPEYDEALKYVARHNFSVVHSFRNPLDEFISREKHSQSALASHCPSEDAACRQKALSARPSVRIEEALKFVNTQITAYRALRVKLQDYGVRVLEMRYEEYAVGNEHSRVHHLQRMADFLLPPHRHRKMTMHDFDTGIEATSSYNQSQKVANYDELSVAFQKSPFSHLLH